jgi:hypothetical protein
VSVFTDRSQGGTAYKNGRIELILNRRIFTDEGMGVRETLNEVDHEGHGLNVSTTFYLSFTDSKQNML